MCMPSMHRGAPDTPGAMQTHVFGNPHSANPSSLLSSERIEAARDEVLAFFGAQPGRYEVVFTKSATGALQITGETFPWRRGSVFRCAACMPHMHCSDAGPAHVRQHAFRACLDVECGRRYTRENHNSVLGIREYALAREARFQAVEEDWVTEWLCRGQEDGRLTHPGNGTTADPTYSLFAYPAEENFSGKKYPLGWVRDIQVCAGAA
jgi:molybdenum cofactor sulfurtransferase